MLAAGISKAGVFGNRLERLVSGRLTDPVNPKGGVNRRVEVTNFGS